MGNIGLQKIIFKNHRRLGNVSQAMGEKSQTILRKLQMMGKILHNIKFNFRKSDIIRLYIHPHEYQFQLSKLLVYRLAFQKLFYIC